MKKTKDYESFFAMYKSKDIVYPSAVARYFGINIKAAYEVCENRLNKDLRKLYMIKCPVCNCTLPDLVLHYLLKMKKNLDIVQ